MIRVTLTDRVDFTALGERWRDLELRAAGSFFLSWTWIGCLVEERFPRPLLVEAIEDGRTVALALFNRGRRWGLPMLWLHESGSAELDSPYIEQNGVLAEAGREAELTRLCLQPVLRRFAVVLSGVDALTATVAEALAGIVPVRKVQASPYADLARLRAEGRDFLATRRANTRQQIGRSLRWYASESGAGAPRVEPPESVEQAWSMLDSLSALHQATWTERGKAGSFSRPFFRRFHRALIARGLERGEVALLKISYGEIIVGYLYNFQFRNKMSSYQSGFRYQRDVSVARPGLVAHVAAIRLAVGQSTESYEFLAGDDRYKRSLSDAERSQFWLEAGPVWAPGLLLSWLRRGGPVRWGAPAKCRDSLHAP